MSSVPTPAPLLVGLATTQSISTKSTSNTQSSSRTTTVIGTISSSSSSNASTTSTSSSSASKTGLSTGARVGLGVGLALFLILCLILFAYLKRRCQTTWSVDREPALPASELSQYPPSQSAARSQGGDLPPPPRLDAASPNSLHPSSTPARPASFYSPTYTIPYETSASAIMMTTLNAPATASSNNSQPGHQLPAPHADITRHQNGLEQRKQSFDKAQEPHDAPPKYSS